jgi:hypothetical protein
MVSGILGIGRFRRAVALGALAIASLLVPTTTRADSITNGSFELGLTGWSTSGGSVTTVSSHTLVNEGGTRTAVDGSVFARLEAGAGVGVYTMLSQAFQANAGDTLSLSAFFDAGDYLPYNDDAYVKVIDSTTSYTLFTASVGTVGDYGSTPWTNINYTFVSTGTFQIEAGVRNVTDNGLNSFLGIDGVKTNTVVSPEATAAPLPGIAVAGMSLLGGLGAVKQARRRRLV